MRLGLGLGLTQTAVGGAVVTPLATLLTTLEASTLWAKLDAFYVMVGDDRLVNRKNPGTFDLTVSGATFVDRIGYVCDGVDDSLGTGFNPSTAGGNYTQNSASFGYWSRSSHPVATGTPMGVFATNGNTLTGRTSINNNGSYRINQAASQATTGAAVTDHNGLIACDRSSSSASQFFYNGVSRATGADQTSTALINDTFDFGTATGSTFAALTFGAGFIGGSLTDAEHLDLYTDLAAFWATHDVLNPEFKPEAYSWWADPIAEVQAGRIVVGGSIGPGAGQDGANSYMEIRESDGAVMSVKRMQDRYRLDDHHVSISKRLASGTRLAFMTGHGLKDDGATADNTLAIATSATGRIADFGAISTVTNTMTAVNYGQIHQMASGRVIITTNCDGNILWGSFYSDNDGTSWTVAKPHVTQAVAPGGGQNQMYEKAVKIGDTAIRLFNVPHPTNTQNNIRVARIDTTSGNYFSGVTDFGSVYQAFGAALTDVTNLAAITALAAGRSQRLLDVNADGTMFLVVEFDNPGGANASYFLYRLTGADYATAADWTKGSAIVSAGTPFWATSFYYGGAVFARHAHSGILICTARESGGTKFIEQRASADSGANWTATELKQSATLLARPIATGSSSIPWIWQRITSYTDFDTWSGMSLEWQ